MGEGVEIDHRRAQGRSDVGRARVVAEQEVGTVDQRAEAADAQLAGQRHRGCAHRAARGVDGLFLLGLAGEDGGQPGDIPVRARRRADIRRPASDALRRRCTASTSCRMPSPITSGSASQSLSSACGFSRQCASRSGMPACRHRSAAGNALCVHGVKMMAASKRPSTRRCRSRHSAAVDVLAASASASASPRIQGAVNAMQSSTKGRCGRERGTARRREHRDRRARRRFVHGGKGRPRHQHVAELVEPDCEDASGFAPARRSAGGGRRSGPGSGVQGAMPQAAASDARANRAGSTARRSSAVRLSARGAALTMKRAASRRSAQR